jgi:hypothetical protein
MSTSSSSLSSLHHIGILMSPVGRFLQCSKCQLSFTFPDGITFGALAKQFDAHACAIPARRPAWQTDGRFVVLKYEGRIATWGSCERCERKFFTPTALMRDASGAEEYLGNKFDMHECAEPKR